MTWREWPIASERLNRRSDGRATEHHPIHARRSMHASGARRHTSRPTPSCAVMRGREMMEAPHCALRHCAIGHPRTATPKAQQRAQAQATPAPRGREEGRGQRQEWMPAWKAVPGRCLASCAECRMLQAGA
eukprot:CAMPEP_0185156842 /NCGR_PEP_ID=MMETSP1139-20130426/1390_1 /TAXON_ID=298111 /ORGANISM="Pavlova sp., Strain CCMP459" /LENGTH=130 /DNA_ID=CAMNT_0027721875 /DNA_START=108 /DNA_END=500 /DNA_ORIENTATION=+